MTTELPEWALPIRDAMARANALARLKRQMPDFPHDQIKAVLPDANDAEDATAALAEALPMVAEHFAGVAIRTGLTTWPEHIATAIRREVGL